MPINCFFKFERATPIYYSGELICGSVSFMTSKRIRIELLTLNLVGSYQVQWNEKSQTPIIEHCDAAQIDHRINYNVSKLFLNESIKLLQSSEVEAGAHTFDLRFTLPLNSPPTMKQDLGDVAYNIQLMLHRPAKHIKMYKQRIVIKPYLDLNNIPTNPLNENIIIDGHHNINIYLPHTTFVPGQPIRNAFKYAKLPAIINRIKMNLLQNITYKSFEPSMSNKKISKLIATINWNTNDSEPYLVPPLTIPTTTLNNDWPIQVSYYLEYSLLNHNSKILIKVFKPIIIGTIALKTRNYYAMNELRTPYCFDNLGSSVLETENNYIKTNAREKQAEYDKINYCINTSYGNKNQIVNCERITLLS